MLGKLCFFCVYRAVDINAPPSISDPQPNWRDFFAKISVTTKIQKPKILVKISVTPNWLKTGFFVTRQSSHFLGSRPGIVDFRRESAAGKKILIFRGHIVDLQWGFRILLRETRNPLSMRAKRARKKLGFSASDFSQK